VIKKSVEKALGVDIFAQALKIFLDNAEKDFILMNLYIEAEDYLNAKQLSHKLIGSCESIGVKKLPKSLRKLDTNLKNRYVKREDLKEINTRFEELKSFIKTEYLIEINE
jgi:HPt (histidine-containing phosphotransfer) domain-containing protein